MKGFSILVSYSKFMQWWRPLGVSWPLLRYHCNSRPLEGGDRNLPLFKNSNNLTHISTSEHKVRNLLLAFFPSPLQCREHFLLPNRQTSTSHTLRQTHTVHHFFSLCGRSLNRAAAWWKLSGNFSLGNPRECDSKGPLSERKIPPLWALQTVSNTVMPHSAEHREGNIL